VQSDQWQWASARTIGVLLGGLVVLGSFVRRTLSVPHPALDLRLGPFLEQGAVESF
jgi:hypothetical protein